MSHEPYTSPVNTRESNTELKRMGLQVNIKWQNYKNKLLKSLTEKDRRYSTDKLHIDPNILKAKHIYEMSVLTFVHGCVKGTPIDSFKNCYDFRGDTHN